MHEQNSQLILLKIPPHLVRLLGKMHALSIEVLQSYTEKPKFSFSFMFLFAMIMFLPTRQLSRQKANIFPSHFASIMPCSACLVGLIWGKNSFVPKNEPKYHFNN